MKKRKFKLIFASLSCVLAILACTVHVFAVEDSPPMYSIGGGQTSGAYSYDDVFLTMPGHVYSYAHFGDSYINNLYKFGLSYAPLFFADSDFYIYNNLDSSTFTSDNGVTLSTVDYLNYDYDLVYDQDMNFVYTGSVSEVLADSYLESWDFSLSDQFVYLVAEDFYLWSDDSHEPELPMESELGFEIMNPNGDYSFGYLQITYSISGSDIKHQQIFLPGERSSFDSLIFNLNSDILNHQSSNGYAYVHEVVICLNNNLFDPDFAPYDYYLDFYIICCYNAYCRDYDVEGAQKYFDAENPAVPLTNYTAWLGEAVSGFLDLQLFPYFTIGGILTTLVAFVCVIWFLKIFAGG